MSWRITYKDKYSGKTTVQKNNNSEYDARGWCKSLAKEHNCKAVCEHVADGPYDRSGTVMHVCSEGDSR